MITEIATNSKHDRNTWAGRKAILADALSICTVTPFNYLLMRLFDPARAKNWAHVAKEGSLTWLTSEIYPLGYMKALALDQFDGHAENFSNPQDQYAPLLELLILEPDSYVLEDRLRPDSTPGVIAALLLMFPEHKNRILLYMAQRLDTSPWDICSFLKSSNFLKVEDIVFIFRNLTAEERQRIAQLSKDTIWKIARLTELPEVRKMAISKSSREEVFMRGEVDEDSLNDLTCFGWTEEISDTGAFLKACRQAARISSNLTSKIMKQALRKVPKELRSSCGMHEMLLDLAVLRGQVDDTTMGCWVSWWIHHESQLHHVHHVRPVGLNTTQKHQIWAVLCLSAKRHSADELRLAWWSYLPYSQDQDLLDFFVNNPTLLQGTYLARTSASKGGLTLEMLKKVQLPLKELTLMAIGWSTSGPVPDDQQEWIMEEICKPENLVQLTTWYLEKLLAFDPHLLSPISAAAKLIKKPGKQLIALIKKLEDQQKEPENNNQENELQPPGKTQTLLDHYGSCGVFAILIKWRRVVDDVRTLIEIHNTEFNVFAKSVLGFPFCL